MLLGCQWSHFVELLPQTLWLKTSHTYLSFSLLGSLCLVPCSQSYKATIKVSDGAVISFEAQSGKYLFPNSQIFGRMQFLMVLGLRVMFSCCLEARALAALLIEVCPQFLEATCSSLPHGFLQYGCLLLQSQQSRETPARMAYCSSNMPVMLSTFSPLLKLFALPWNVYPSDSSMACFFISFRSLLRCHLLAEVFPNYLI